MKRLTVLIAIVAGAVLVCMGGAVFLGGTKMRRLFGASADALAGPDVARARDAGTPP